MGNTRCQQADGRQFFRLDKLILKLDTLRLVIDDDHLSGHLTTLTQERSYGNVHGERPSGSLQRVLVKGDDFRTIELISAETRVNGLNQVSREKLLKLPSKGLRPRRAEKLFHLGVAALDALIQP